MDVFTRGDMQIEYQQGHGDGKYSVAEGGQPFHALSGNAVVERMHRRESSTGGSTVLEPECKPR
jgi:hypothetical protein